MSGAALVPWDAYAEVEEDDYYYGGRKTTALKDKLPFAKLAEILREARYSHNILDQDEVWVGRDGLKVELAKMSARYATNILGFLRKNAKYYHNGWATWEFVKKYSDQSADELEELLETGTGDKIAREWVKSQKLYKALETISKQSV